MGSDVQNILDILNDSKYTDLLKIIAIIGALASAYECYADNMIFLSKIGFFHNVDTKAIGIRGAKADCMGIPIGLYLLYLKYNQEYDAKAINLHRAKFFGMICDLIAAIDDAGILEKIRGQSLNDGQ